jgi:hypothetical protein
VSDLTRSPLWTITKEPVNAATMTLLDEALIERGMGADLLAASVARRRSVQAVEIWSGGGAM